MGLIKLHQIGWFSTGRDKAARDLLTAVSTGIKQGEIEAEIAFVFCSREPGESAESDLFIKLAEDYQIPLICLSYQRFKAREDTSATDHGRTLPSWRLGYDREVMSRLPDFIPDLFCRIKPVARSITMVYRVLLPFLQTAPIDGFVSKNAILPILGRGLRFLDTDFATLLFSCSKWSAITTRNAFPDAAWVSNMFRNPSRSSTHVPLSGKQ